jgi:hypothetical protein
MGVFVLCMLECDVYRHFAPWNAKVKLQTAISFSGSAQKKIPVFAIIFRNSCSCHCYRRYGELHCPWFNDQSSASNFEQTDTVLRRRRVNRTVRFSLKQPNSTDAATGSTPSVFINL